MTRPVAAAAAKLANQTYTAREWDADANLFYYRARWFDQSFAACGARARL